MREPEPKVRLDVLDPAADDPGYWARFENDVIQRVRPAMARRRQTHLTLEGVVFTWGRVLLPAVAAAVIAALLLTGEAPSQREEDVAGVEEVLTSPVGEDSLPAVLHSGDDFGRELVLLAVEVR